jgi:hypothetical protein
MVRWTLLLLAALMLGCSGNKTETGYEYRPLSDSPSVQRAYYAQPFTPEAGGAANDRKLQQELRRPQR